MGGHGKLQQSSPRAGNLACLLSRKDGRQSLSELELKAYSLEWGNPCFRHIYNNAYYNKRGSGGVCIALAATIVYVRYYCLCSVTIGHAC